MANNDLRVIYGDDALLVLDKPAGLLSVPGRGDDKQDCLSKRVQDQFPDALVVHRLDMATSGLMVMARDTFSQRVMSKLFACRSVQKRYIAVVDGCLQPDNGSWQSIDLPIALDWPNRPLRIIDATVGKPSLTHWRTTCGEAVMTSARFRDDQQFTRVELAPVTGRSHQLRVHLKALGHAILGDSLYASAEVKARADRLLLHASSLQFKHPLNGRELSFSSTPTF